MRYIGPALFLVAAIVLGAAQSQGPAGKLFRSLVLQNWQFRSCQLVNLVVADSELHNPNVATVKLRGGKLSDLRASQLQLGGLGLENASVRGVSGSHLRLEDLRVENSELRSVHLRNTDLRDVRFERLDIYGGLGGLSDWTTWKSIRFYQNDFNDFAFDYCDFYHGRFERCDIRDVSFRWCDFSYVELRGCDIRGMTIDGVDVEKAIEEYKRNH